MMTEVLDWNALHLKSVETLADAELIADIYSASLDAVANVLDDENAALRAGRVADALALTELKQTRAVDYTRATDLLRRNLVSLTVFIPARLQDLKARQSTLMTKLNENANLIRTVRSLSEKFLRGVAQNVRARTTLSTYGKNGKETQNKDSKSARAILVSTQT